MKALILALALTGVAPAALAQITPPISKQASPPSYGAPISLAAADARGGRRNLWLRGLDRAGLGFDS